ncbi:uncharacterized protein LOC112504035 [Cynara cardunculus var. scolymus]|uniref:Uncharacterized protein n=1 Tax=Cynara cardunculus var. scolymus TaxID=59895 RepID=A0A103VYF6_CYNCS|nr:uncharacterized protein LOC112504035 [Cynara cardunculus var. scolymus]KVH62480.1 hypothetical protein Ccrd_025648 [Cynara cardunculus var. scolymus]
MLENHHLEFIKQTMLKHEDTFRHQVRELHRLYHVQKNLISTLRNDTKLDTTSVPNATTDNGNEDLGVDLSRHAKECTLYGESSGDQTGCNDVELTLSIGPSTSIRRSQSCLHQTGDNDSEVTTKTNLANSSTLYNQDSKRPHWLFQDLSLNRT